MRVCKKCGEEKPIEEFHKSPSCRYGRTYSCLACISKYCKSRYQKIRPTPKPKAKPIEKACSKCGKVFPLTEEFFYKKKVYWITTDGEYRSTYSYRTMCRSCHTASGEKRRIKKRLAELGCEKEDYRKAWTGKIALARLKFKELQDIPRLQRIYIVRSYLKTGELVPPELYKEWVKKRLKNKHIRQRKYDYGDVDKVTSQMLNEKSLLHLPDARIALIIGLPVKEVPKEMIEAKRALIMLKREAGLTHTTKKQ